MHCAGKYQQLQSWSRSEMDPRGGGCGGVRTPPKYFKMPRHAGVGEEEGGGGGVNCVIVTIECIVILGILIFFFHTNFKS